MNKVSIIVPIYKVEQYIEKCVKSLLNQDYKNIEIILIDDGSPDNSPRIIDELAKLDNRIVIIHSKNLGVSSARNAGLDIASGDYIMFVDGDDYVDQNYVSYFMKMVIDNDCAIGMNQSNYVNDNHSKTNKDKIVIEDAEKVIEYIYLGNVFVAVWNKIYKLQFLNNKHIRFNSDIWYGEGMLFNIQALQYAEKVAIGYLDVYHQVQNPNSAMRKFNLDSNHCGLRSMFLQKECWIKKNKKIEEAWRYHNWCFNISIMSGMARTHIEKKNLDEYNKCSNNLRKGMLVPWQVNIPFKTKIKSTVWAIMPYAMAKRSAWKADRIK